VRRFEEFRSVCGFERASDAEGWYEDLLSIFASTIPVSHHKVLEETYYVLKGEGFLHLDGEKVPIAKGDAVTIRPGVRHHSEGDIEVLIICSPPYESSDCFFDD
jgi:mannose-6-phosphate isomerase-like protein (cupin superfamily)